MRYALALLAALLVIAIGFGLLRAYHWFQRERTQAKQTVETLVRMVPALAEHEQFFKLLELRSDQAHFLERHGPMLRHIDILQRATTGDMPVSGIVGRAVSSARWLTHDDMLWAIESAIQSWEADDRPPGGVFKYEFPKLIGEGYIKDSNALLRTAFAKVIIRDDVVITAFPVLDPNTVLDKPVSTSRGRQANDPLAEADHTDA